MIFGAVIFAADRACAQNLDDVRLEADYILACQYMDSGNSAYGAINDVTGAPTWVMPGENAIAIMGLITASDLLNDPAYKNSAQLSANYLQTVQAGDGGWYNQYNYSQAADAGKDLRHTAEVMIAYDKLGYDAARYDSMRNASEFILAAQNTANKTGLDDGLVGGGKTSSGAYHTQRWTSDNAFAYQALKAAAKWARTNNDQAYATQLDTAADRILTGIRNYLAAGTDHWNRAIDASGNVVAAEDKSDWISYAPLMLDLPMDNMDPAAVGEWIHTVLQKPDGSVVWDDGTYSNRKSPGYSFQAGLVWLDREQMDFMNAAVSWAEQSGLWQKVPDGNNVSGGWIDWVEGAGQAQQWERFIDTSAYYIMIQNGGYDFNVVPEPSTMILFLSGLFGACFRRKP